VTNTRDASARDARAAPASACCDQRDTVRDETVSRVNIRADVCVSPLVIMRLVPHVLTSCNVWRIVSSMTDITSSSGERGTFYVRRASFNPDGTPRGSAFSVTCADQQLRPVPGGFFLRPAGYFVGTHVAPDGSRMVTTCEVVR
jgi:hypothetical protein